ncbi:putative lipid II flippase FtsW [Patescibacteria group bacterium]|nr:putative lipid II flippase FtsW [Patescibacteria group bacterium]
MMLIKRAYKKFNKKDRDEHEPDKKLIYALFILIIFGLVMLASTSAYLAYTKFQNTYAYIQGQIIATSIGVVFFYIVSKTNYQKWKRNAIYFLLISILLLVLVFIPGLSAGHGSARSWILVFGQSLQPAEFVKISFLIYLAAWLQIRYKDIKTMSQGLMPFLIIFALISILMFLQPDLGTWSIIALSSILVYFVGGGNKKHIIALFLIAIIGVYLMVTYTDYQQDRFACLKDPSFDTQEKCYQINQSLIAVGSGGLWGKGLGESRQKYSYLPEVSGDAIFPIISEEIGFIFSSTLILLYTYIFYRGWLIALKAKDMFGRLLAVGIVSWIFFQAFLNIGGMLNLIPMTGVPLPFISAGGSAMLAGLIAMGILVNISRYTVED